MRLRRRDRKRALESVVGVASLLGIAGLLLLPLGVEEAPPLTSSSALIGPEEPTVWPALVVSGDGLGPQAEALAQGIATSGIALVHPGSGFLSGDGLGKVVLEDVEGRDLAAVVVQGGEADVDQPPGSVGMAALELVDGLRASLSPHASITLVGPLPEDEPDASLLRVRDELARAARFKQVHFIDPVELGLRRGQSDLGPQLAAFIDGLVPKIRPAG